MKPEPRPYPLDELMSADIDPRPLIIGKWLAKGSIVMLYAPTGTGKTLITLAIAMSIAAGQPFLDMEVPAPKRVLYVDGEMSILTMQDRLRRIEAGQRWSRCMEHNLAILSHEGFVDGMPSIGDPDDAKGRRMLEKFLDAGEFEVLILDNLSSLMGYGVENDAESWNGLGGWLLGQRRAGRATICVHHAGKPNSRGGYTQRGTSKRIDTFDTCIQLTPEGTNPLTVHWLFEKHRSFQPDEKDGFSFEVPFLKDARDQEVSCTFHKVDDMTREVAEALEWQKKAIELRREEGLSQKQIAERVGKSRSHIGRVLKKAMPLTQNPERSGAPAPSA